MTTDHVALAIINGTTPQQEAGTQPKTAAAKKRKFENVASLAERRKEKVALAEKLAPKMVAGYKVAGIKEVKDSKSSTRVYLKLVDAKGAEPVTLIPYSKEGEIKMYGDLEKIEQDNKLTNGSPAVMYRIPGEYWMRKRTAAKKEEKKDEKKADKKPAPAVKGKGKVAAKPIVPAPAAPKVDVSKLANAPSVSEVTSF